MALREFRDPTGEVWHVWATVPESARDAAQFAHSARLATEARRRDASSPAATSAASPASGSGARFSPGREGGWLTFQRDDEKRRLSPIPDGWAAADEEELAGWLAEAEPVTLSATVARLIGGELGEGQEPPP